MGKGLIYAWYTTKLELCTCLFSLSKSILYLNPPLQKFSPFFMKTGNAWQDFWAQLAFIPGRPPVPIMAIQSAWGPHNHLPSLSSAVMVSQPASFPYSPPLVPSQSHFTCLCLTLCCPCHSLGRGVGGTCAPVSSCSFLPIADGIKHDPHYPYLPKSHLCVIPSPWTWAGSVTCF